MTGYLIVTWDMSGGCEVSDSQTRGGRWMRKMDRLYGSDEVMTGDANHKVRTDTAQENL